ncbi:MAG: restriction endonuclease subunit S, partial [Elusimicrobia bacterium]|nr:restriction endonuclease subunit S [Elusimicrobiota bacterium]
MADSSLSDNAEIVMGQSPPGNASNTTGIGLPLLNGPTEYGAHHPAPVQFTTDSRKRARLGDILFCVRGSTTGRMNWADREYAIGRGVAAIRHKKEPKLQPLVRAVIEYGLPDLLAQATGSTFPNVSADQLANLWWPPLKEGEQRAIARILGTLDDKIELNRRMNETLEQIARAIFKSWFVDFDPVRAKTIKWKNGTVGELLHLNKETVSPNGFPNEVFNHYSIPAFDEGKLPKAELGGQIQSNKFIVPPNAVL